MMLKSNWLLCHHLPTKVCLERFIQSISRWRNSVALYSSGPCMLTAFGWKWQKECSFHIHPALFVDLAWSLSHAQMTLWMQTESTLQHSFSSRPFPSAH